MDEADIELLYSDDKFKFITQLAQSSINVDFSVFYQ